jgi:hypothetical protein
VTSVLDAVWGVASTVHSGVWQLTGPVRSVTARYVALLNLGQPWNMFSNPPWFDEYVRIRYFVGRDQPRWMATELVLPSEREDRVRLVAGYRGSYRDKSTQVMIERFFTKRRDAEMRPDTRPDELPDDLAPLARFYAGRFEARFVSARERLLRTEVWRGVAMNPRLGEAGSPDAMLARRAALLEYYQGPVEVRFNLPKRAPYHAADRDGDIEWLLEYYEEP